MFATGLLWLLVAGMLAAGDFGVAFSLSDLEALDFALFCVGFCCVCDLGVGWTDVEALGAAIFSAFFNEGADRGFSLAVLSMVDVGAVLEVGGCLGFDVSFGSGAGFELARADG